jgi:ABC-2 type transport system permease protein
MSNPFPVFNAALRYEFRMQIHRRELWIAMLLVTLVLIGIIARTPDIVEAIPKLSSFSLLQAVTIWTQIINVLFPIAIGILLADRLLRDRRIKVEEVLLTTPAPLGMRIFGKYLGTLFATLVPVLIGYAVGIAVILAEGHTLAVLWYAVLTFVAIILPGALFIAAFSITLPNFIWVPVYQLLFVGYWFWGNLLPANKGIPTLSQTILAPMGANQAAGFFGLSIVGIQKASVLQGVASIVALVGSAILVLCALVAYLRWRQSRQ